GQRDLRRVRRGRGRRGRLARLVRRGELARRHLARPVRGRGRRPAADGALPPPRPDPDVLLARPLDRDLPRV
ncbi:MAG: Putative polysaccharide deacetylase, partial [uncultured Actinomycetospora sp.]